MQVSIPKKTRSSEVIMFHLNLSRAAINNKKISNVVVFVVNALSYT